MKRGPPRKDRPGGGRRSGPPPRRGGGAVTDPLRAAVLDLLRQSEDPLEPRQIARQLGLRTATERAALRATLTQLAEDGVLASEGGEPPSRTRHEGLPPVTVLILDRLDEEGEPLLVPTRRRTDEADEEKASQEAAAAPPLIRLGSSPISQRLGLGDRVLARLEPDPDEPGTFRAFPIKKLESREGSRLLGHLKLRQGAGWIESTDRRQREEIFVPPEHVADAPDGAMVLAELLGGSQGRLGRQRARILQVLGQADDPRIASLIAIHQHGLPVAFPEAVEAEAAAAGEADLSGGREDLRALPLVTIDGADARDFDDAVHAAPDEDPANQGGFWLTVAIADVAHYVRPGSMPDREAYRRGNSTYFPDRVVPMLPERLSNKLCSLEPAQNRACLGFRMRIDAEGKLLEHRLVRGLMRSAARLTYEQAQAALDGAPDDTTGPLLEPILKPLHAAWQALERGRRRRGTLELELPERVVKLTPEGRVATIALRARLDTHRLIEEFMITANVAAAETLERQRAPCVYRVHDRPDPAKLEAVADTMRSLGLRLPGSLGMAPRDLARVIAQAPAGAERQVVSDLVLRAQAQAAYTPTNIGHYGLALPRYAHFTSPIRRYADLLVHRALIEAASLGADGLSGEERQTLAERAQHISETERRSQAAERDATDRYVAAWLAERIGQTFTGTITNVQRFGLFVRLEESGADGLIPVAQLPGDFYRHDPRRGALIGQRFGRVFQAGATVETRLIEASGLSGSTVLELVGASRDGAAPERRPGETAPRTKPPRPGKPVKAAKRPKR